MRKINLDKNYFLRYNRSTYGLLNTKCHTNYAALFWVWIFSVDCLFCTPVDNLDEDFTKSR